MNPEEYEYVSDKVDQCLLYNDYIIENCIKAERYFKHKIIELQDAAKTDNISNFDKADLEDMMLFQELLAEKLEAYLNSFDNNEWRKFVDTYKNEEISVTEYKRDFKIKSLFKNGN